MVGQFRLIGWLGRAPSWGGAARRGARQPPPPEKDRELASYSSDPYLGHLLIERHHLPVPAQRHDPVVHPLHPGQRVADGPGALGRSPRRLPRRGRPARLDRVGRTTARWVMSMALVRAVSPSCRWYRSSTTAPRWVAAVGV